MRHEWPDRPISVAEVQGFLVHHPLDCNLDSREVMEQIENHFGWRIRVATLVLACLWSGIAVIPFDNGQRFRFCKVE